jgi:hypothetical protein
VPAYRLYKLRDADRIAGSPVVIECNSDAEVIAKAKAMLDGLDIEVWDGPRVVARLPAVHPKIGRLIGCPILHRLAPQDAAFGGDESGAQPMKDKHKEYARYAAHCLNMVTVAEDRDARSIQREMAAEWIKLADAILQPLVPAK